MPLIKNSMSMPPAESTVTVAPERIGGTRQAGDSPKRHMSKEEYWERKEERDIQRDKDMAWSGFAQAAITSPYVAQFNIENTEEGLVALVERITNKLMQARNRATK